MTDPQVGEIWRHTGAGAVAVRFRLAGPLPPVFVVVDDTGRVLAAEREELAPARYDEAVEYANSRRKRT